MIVIRSQGGDVSSGLDMAEALLPRKAVVIGYDYCISSCANYIMAAGARRIVYDNTVLGFHGGADSVSFPDILAAFRKAGLPDPVGSARHAWLTTQKTVQRQRVFLRDAGIGSDLFDRFNHLPDKARARICDAKADYIVFSPAFLRRHGYRLAVYDGPLSPGGLRAALKRIGDAPSAACYVDVERPRRP